MCGRIGIGAVQEATLPFPGSNCTLPPTAGPAVPAADIPRPRERRRAPEGKGQPAKDQGPLPAASPSLQDQGQPAAAETGTLDSRIKSAERTYIGAIGAMTRCSKSIVDNAELLPELRTDSWI